LLYPLLAAADVCPGVPVAEPVEEQPDGGATGKSPRMQTG
jgi:hypothetical protein